LEKGKLCQGLFCPLCLQKLCDKPDLTQVDFQHKMLKERNKDPETLTKNSSRTLAAGDTFNDDLAGVDAFSTWDLLTMEPLAYSQEPTVLYQVFLLTGEL
jgi:hypothetical protein